MRAASARTLRCSPSAAVQCVAPVRVKEPPVQLRNTLPSMVAEDLVNETVAAWSKQYPLPDEAAEGSRAEVKQLYRCGTVHEQLLQGSNELTQC